MTGQPDGPAAQCWVTTPLPPTNVEYLKSGKDGSSWRRGAHVAEDTFPDGWFWQRADPDGTVPPLADVEPFHALLANFGPLYAATAPDGESSPTPEQQAAREAAAVAATPPDENVYAAALDAHRTWCNAVIGPSLAAEPTPLAAQLSRVIVNKVWPIALLAARATVAREAATAVAAAAEPTVIAGADEQPVSPAVAAARSVRLMTYEHTAALAWALRLPDCGDQYHGADGGPCTRCGFDPTRPAPQGE